MTEKRGVQINFKLSKKIELRKFKVQKSMKIIYLLTNFFYIVITKNILITYGILVKLVRKVCCWIEAVTKTLDDYSNLGSSSSITELVQ